MFELVARDIVGAGVAAGVFAPCDVAFTSNAIMTLYLGAVSQVNAEGKHWLDTAALATFVMRALGAVPE